MGRIRKDDAGVAAAAVIPGALDRPEFREAWSDWLAFRAEIKEPCGPVAQKRQLNQLAAMGWHKAIAAIDQSIRRNWQGLFEPQDYRPPAEISADVLRIVREVQGDLFQ